MKPGILVKVHTSYRWIVALCDSDLVGKKFEEGILQLDLSTGFFDGTLLSGDALEGEIDRALREDATFFIVGRAATSFAQEQGLIDVDGVKTVDGVPFALVLL